MEELPGAFFERILRDCCAEMEADDGYCGLDTLRDDIQERIEEELDEKGIERLREYFIRDYVPRLFTREATVWVPPEERTKLVRRSIVEVFSLMDMYRLEGG
jgi:hypothetical protein